MLIRDSVKRLHFPPVTPDATIMSTFSAFPSHGQVLAATWARDIISLRSHEQTSLMSLFECIDYTIPEGKYPS